MSQVPAKNKEQSIGKTLRNLVFMGIYFFLLLEIGCRIIYSLPAFKSRLYANDEGTWRRTWYNNHKDGGLYFKLDEHHPKLGWFSRANHSEVKWYYTRTEINTNSQGFRSKREYSLKKSPDSTRILLIGDSFTFGESITDDSTFASVLQRSIPQATIINAGIHGYGHDQILILLKEYGLQYDPDIIILGYLTEDMHRNLLGFRDYMKPRYKLKDGTLKLVNIPIPSPSKLLKTRIWYPRTMYLYHLLKFKADNKSGKYEEDQAQITKAILKEMAAEADKIDAKMLFAFIPYNEQTFDMADTIKQEKYLFDICAEPSISAKAFSTRPAFKEGMANGIDYVKQGHFREKGHKSIAAAIEQYLIEQDLIK